MPGRATIVVGLGFGDEGKGSIVDYLVREEGACAVVRFNGGAQAAHNVVTEDGREHTFAQFGSGTFVPGVETLLSDRVLVNPLNLLVEDAHLREQGVSDAMERLTIDPGAVVITPLHVAANRRRELGRGKDRHGSCGQGVGEARGDQLAGRPTLYARDLGNPDRVLDVLGRIAATKLLDLPRDAIDGVIPDAEGLLADYAIVAERVGEVRPRLHTLLRSGSVVFEGAQGILLDETHGVTPPHVTWTDTTAANAFALLTAFQAKKATTIGVLRAYLTRHGPGPFPSEDEALTADLQEESNATNVWQGKLRVGHLDLGLLRHATMVQHVDKLALTCLDRVADRPKWQINSGDYPFRLSPTLEHHERLLPAYAGNAPVALASYGPTAADKVRLRP